MKNKKKKILIFLLSAACLTAGAFGIAACKDKTADPLKQAYESYVGSVGDGALSFDEWKLLIGQNVKPDVKSKYISSASIEANGALSLLYDDGTAFAAGTLAGNLLISYADGSTQTVALPSAASSAKKAPELDNKYSQYVQAAGDSALPYEQWLELIKTGIMPDVSGKTVTGANVTEKCEFILTFDDGTTVSAGTVLNDLEFSLSGGTSQTVKMPKLFTATVSDQNNKPVADVWVQFYLYDPSTYTRTVIENAKTGADGKVYFTIAELDQTVKYLIRLCGTDDITDEPPLPDNYTVNSTGDIDEHRNSAIKLNYAPDSFVLAKKQKMNYKRVDVTIDIQETNDPTVKKLEADRYGYFIFQPYQPYTPKDPTESSASIANKEQRAVKAATGKYRVKVTCDTAGANAVLYQYSGSSSYIVCDPVTGIPTAVAAATGNAPANSAAPDVYTGTDYIDLNLSTDMARSETIFGVHADKACTVTLTVERLGDAAEPPVIVTKRIKPTGSQFKWADKTGTLKEVPVDNSVSVVKGKDGFYHIGSESGPILLINLAKTLDRVAECAIKDLPLQEIGSEGQTGVIAESVFTFATAYDENGFIIEKSNYTDVINTYAKYVNSDGVYGVNDDLYNFLKYFGSSCIGVNEAPKESWWLLPCQYYDKA